MASSYPAIFPNEIFDIIISNVFHAGTLYSLGQCCWTFALSAEPRLYSSLKLTDSPKTIKIARTLVQSSRKSSFVFTIVAELIDVEFVLLPAGMKLVLAAIVGCFNLSRLSVAWGPRHNWATRYLLSNGFQLYKFVSWFQWDHTVCRFLETQPSLRELEIVRPGPDITMGDGSEPRLRSFALPHLSSFMGRLPQALTIVPGRPVASIILYGAVTLTQLDAALPLLALSSVQMESLSLQTGELSSPLLTMISAYLPNLSRLEVRVVRHSTVAYSNLTSESLCQALSLMTRLNYFWLRLRCPQLFHEPYFDTQRDVILEWKNHCPTLNKIVFESSNENKAPEWTFDEEAMDWMCSLDE